MKRILVLCGSNSCRSQMAEGYLKFYARQWADVHSAGVRKTQVHPLTFKIMEEDSIDVSRQLSKTYKRFRGQHFDYVITLCDEAKDHLPKDIYYDAHLHFDIPDPALAKGNRESRLGAFREVREIIKTEMLRLIGSRLMEKELSPA